MKLVIFGCGKIAKRIAASCKKVEEIELVGFGSKDIDKAKEYADLFGCKDYGDYDHFLNSDVDAVYIAVYNPGHEELIRKCLCAHKNVICEKPMLFNLRQNEEAFACARENDVLLMEALKSVFLPSIIEVKRMVKEKEIGEVKEISASFMRAGHHPDTHWINQIETGGAFKDLGSYCVGTMNFVLDKEGKLLSLESDRTKEKAETTAYADIDYDGVKGKVSVSNRIDGGCDLIVQGTRGRIQVHNYWKEGKISYEIDGVSYEKDVPLISDFYYELQHFAVLCDKKIKESPIMNEEASAAILKITGCIDN